MSSRWVGARRVRLPVAASLAGSVALVSALLEPVYGGSRATPVLDAARVAIVAAGGSKAEKSAAALVAGEIEKRTGFRPTIGTRWPVDGTPVIALGTAAAGRAWAGPHAALIPPRPPGKPEGYAIRAVRPAAGAAPAVLVAGNDPRGVLFGAGRLLRELAMTRGRVRLDAEVRIESWPRTPLRGHQLGYRPKTNSYDGWTEDQWRQYVRDLVVFGTNAVELIPPRSDDARDSPHFPLPPIEMLARMSRILDEHDLDVWIWYPALDPDYTDPATVKAALAEWSAVFSRMSRLDHVFVPGGDPGHTPPGPMLAFLARVADEVRRTHPAARVWMSPQGFGRERFDDFLRILREREPAWLEGVVYGPQTRVSLAELRRAIPARYPIRRYPDITHSLSCQFPVPDWDLAYALTEGREVINPRPGDQAAIFRAQRDQAIGFIAYSEGCNDDLNKVVWSALGWDPEADVAGIVREYSRYFLGPELEESFTRGIFALERNWRGPLLDNASVEATLALFRALEREASPRLLLDWRFQQALYRAYYDAYIRRRLRHESDLERRAMDRLRQAPTLGAAAAMDQAAAILAQADASCPSPELRTRIHQLAEALFQSVRMQLSVPLYRAIAVERGANLDTLDEPLNNRRWLERRFADVRVLDGETERLAALDRILRWQEPGPGGFYDELGNPTARPHLVAGLPYEQDPDFLRSPITGFASRPDWRTSWRRHADALWGGALRMRYTGLDPARRYRLRVVYAGTLTHQVRLTAGSIEIHPMIAKPDPVRPLEFDVPPAALQDGTLELAWTSVGGRAGRGAQVAEVWLMRE